MGSTSGTRAGDRDMVPGALLGDTIPVPTPTTVMRKHDLKDNSNENTEMINHPYSLVVNLFHTFAFGFAGALVFDCSGLSFVLFVLQILSFLPPNLCRKTNRKHRTFSASTQLQT